MDKTEKLTVTVPASLIRRVRKQAEKEGRNLSNMVTVILRKGVTKEGKAA